MVVESHIPTSSWSPGAVSSYPMTLELPDDLASGSCRFLGEVYLWPSLERLESSGIPRNALEPTPVEVVP
jgi:hypothetical protein